MALQEQNSHSGWPAVIGIIILVLAAIGLIRELQSSLNTILGLTATDRTLMSVLIRYLKAMIPLIL